MLLALINRKATGEGFQSSNGGAPGVSLVYCMVMWYYVWVDVFQHRFGTKSSSKL